MASEERDKRVNPGDEPDVESHRFTAQDEAKPEAEDRASDDDGPDVEAHVRSL
jgi:hypothetical protein